MAQFSSQGFDLDASRDENVVYEVTGGVTKLNVNDDHQQEPNPADSFKLQGNQAFQQQQWKQAYELYTKAIEATPGMTGIELLKLRDEWQKEQNKEARRKLIEKEERERKRKEQGQKEEQEDEDEPQPKPEKFQPPHHPHASELATYHSNRAATLLYMEEYTEAIQDCDIAILLNPLYTKAYVRRATACEKTGDTEQALQDAKEAQKLDPGNPTIRTTVARLQKLEDERLEKLKTETMEKLKDLGNSILGNFGLSLNNFQAVQDPNTGSYSISFNQNK